MSYYVYILTNSVCSVLYTGMTNDLVRRIYEHRQKFVPGFTTRFNASRLVYYETLDHPQTAIAREKQIKGGSRKAKMQLVDAFNPDWQDLYERIAG